MGTPLSTGEGMRARGRAKEVDGTLEWRNSLVFPCHSSSVEPLRQKRIQLQGKRSLI